VQGQRLTRGRLAFTRLMPITETMQDMILKSATALENFSRNQSRTGVRDLVRQSGLLKVQGRQSRRSTRYWDAPNE